MQKHKEQDLAGSSGNEFIKQIGFSTAFKFLLASSFLGVITQNIYDKTNTQDEFNLLGISIVVIVFSVFGIIWGKKVYRVIDTPYFAISSILLLAGGTALGTFIGQNMTSTTFQTRYGPFFSDVFSFLKIDDLFHSWWYVILFLLLTISLLKISIKKGFNKENLGFQLAHLGPVVVLMGFWLDFYQGYRGLIQLTKGDPTNLVSVYRSNTNKIIDTISLDFNLRLNDFKSEKFEPDHRIQIWENNNSADQKTKSRIVASLPIDIDKPRKVYGTDIEFTVKEFYPNFYLEYSYPEEADTVVPINPGILFELINPHGGNIIHLRTSGKGKNQLIDPILGIAFEFYWDVPDKIKQLINNPNTVSSWSQEPKVIFIGSENMIYEVINGKITNKNALPDKEYPIPGKSKSTYKTIFIYPDAAYLQSEPATINLSQDNPVLRMEIKRDGWEEVKNAFIFPSEKGPGGQFVVPESKYLFALESIRDNETKFWESDLSLVSLEGIVLKKQKIKVNDPLSYNGFRFYQSDYDPDNPNYSGIGVSYTPGLPLIYLGFYLITGGILILFYLKYRYQDSLQQ